MNLKIAVLPGDGIGPEMPRSSVTPSLTKRLSAVPMASTLVVIRSLTRPSRLAWMLTPCSSLL